MLPLFQFMNDTGWKAVAIIAVMSAFHRLYWNPRVLAPAIKEFEAMDKRDPGYFRATLRNTLLVVPYFLVTAPVAEELVFRAPLFIWGPSLSDTGQWRLFWTLVILGILGKPQFYLGLLGKVLAASEIEAERRTRTAEDARVILSSVRRGRIASEIPGFLAYCVSYITVGLLCWKAQTWTGSYWGAVVANQLSLPLLLVITATIVLIFIVGFNLVMWPWVYFTDLRNRVVYRARSKKLLPRFLRKNMW